MSDYSIRNFGRDTIVWPSSTCPRNYVHGLCSNKTLGVSGGFKRTPFLRSVNFTSGGTVVRKMPITSVFRMKFANMSPMTMHPIVDPSYCFAAYGLNIQGTTLDETALSALPTATAKATSTGWGKSVSNAIAWFSANGEAFFMMPSTLTTNKIKGAMYNELDSYFHVRNGIGVINTTGTLVASVDGTFPYYGWERYWANSSRFPGRTDILYHPSMFAVVHCINCVPYGMGITHLSSEDNPINTSSVYPVPEFKPNDFGNMSFYIKYTDSPIGAETDIVRPETNKDNITMSQRLWYNPQDSSESVYFVWGTPGFSESMMSNYYYYDFHSAPYISVVPAPVQELGQTMTVRILQYAVEFNF